MLKDIPTFYSANPEFKGRTGKAANELSKMQETRSKEKVKGELDDADHSETQAKLAAELESEGCKINVLDALNLNWTLTKLVSTP